MSIARGTGYRCRESGYLLLAWSASFISAAEKNSGKNLVGDIALKNQR